MQAISFDLTGSFAAFRDPSVTTNQTVYYIPSKTALVGLVGAILGIKRDNTLGDMYGKEFLDFYAKTKIGIRVNSQNPEKHTFYTNHRSLKDGKKKSGKTKPVKKEVLVDPSYTIYVMTESNDELIRRLQTNNFVFTPYLGHAYCPAIVKNAKLHNIKKSEKNKHRTSCVILDESEPFSSKFEFKCMIAEDNATVMIERHLHHYFLSDKFTKKVMRHWIPIRGKVKTDDFQSVRKISDFFDINEESVCFY